MDFTTAVNLLWDLATGVSVGLLAYGAWLCLEYRFASDDLEESKAASIPTHSLQS
jgi:hypothetical protein